MSLPGLAFGEPCFARRKGDECALASMLASCMEFAAGSEEPQAAGLAAASAARVARVVRFAREERVFMVR